jgi:molecular chaperone GrpE
LGRNEEEEGSEVASEESGLGNRCEPEGAGGDELADEPSAGPETAQRTEEGDSGAALGSELSQYRREAQENYDRFVRVYAEFENYKKRAVKDKTEFIKYANEGLVKALLGVIDNLERAVDESKKNAHAEGLVEGVEMVLNQLKDILDKHGVREVQAQGAPFDPNLHEAMMHEDSEEHEDNTVIEEFQRGYILNDRLLRPALVKVSRKVEKKADVELSEEK